MSPRVQAAVGVGFVLFLLGAAWQWRRLRAGTLAGAGEGRAATGDGAR
ncbi:MAG TPA: hypothetical protein VNB03_12175 [Casimicrobiaceae bacterium]|nr:hypothetical protein [Casimicrobiaceae bacterium]